jgi:hypothetical protein
VEVSITIPGWGYRGYRRVCASGVEAQFSLEPTRSVFSNTLIHKSYRAYLKLGSQDNFRNYSETPKCKLPELKYY